MMLQHSTQQQAEALAHAAKAHVAASMHVPVETAPWPGKAALPRYLTAAYSPVVARVGDTPMLWLLAAEPVTPGVLRTHIARIREAWPDEVAFVAADITAKQRQRLVAAGIPFVVPGRHVYLPGLGVDLRERTRTALEPRERLRPAAQATLLWLLLHDTATERTTNDLIKALGYERMTLSRSIRELEAAGALVPGRTRRPKSFRLADEPRLVWDAMLPRISSPVARVNAVARDEPALAAAPLAGSSALAEYSDIAAPATATWAVAARAFPELGVRVLDEADEDTGTVEGWTYDPRLLTTGSVVDPLSLYAALRDDPDERVAKALARMLEEVWR